MDGCVLVFMEGLTKDVNLVFVSAGCSKHGLHFVETNGSETQTHWRVWM